MELTSHYPRFGSAAEEGLICNGITKRNDSVAVLLVKDIQPRPFGAPFSAVAGNGGRPTSAIGYLKTIRLLLAIRDKAPCA